MPSFNTQTFLAAHPEVWAEWANPNSGNQQFYTNIDDYIKNSVGAVGTPAEQQALANGQFIGSNGRALNSAQGQPAQTTDPAAATASNPFGSGGLANLINTGAQQGATGATVNPNTQEIMAATQNGATASQGNTATTGTQSQIGTQQGTTSQLQNTTGTQAGTTIGGTTGSQQGTQATQQVGQVGTTGTSQPVDTLGFGQLLQQQVPGAQSATQTQQDFLKGVVANGPANQQALTSRAVNQAMSGPGMVGAGENAQARAASDAAATVGVNSLNQQLQAASQLANPTQTTNLATAANPYVGTQTAGNQTSNQAGTTNTGQTSTGTTNQSTSGTNTQNLVNDVNSLNLSSLLNNTATNTAENQSGTSSANSGQVGIGNVPESKQQTSGGCYVCTDLVDRGLMAPGAVRRAARWKLAQTRFQRSLVGYSLYGPFVARHHLVPRSVARLILYEECRLAGVKVAKRLDATGLHAVFHYLSLAIAVLTGRKEIRQCDADTVAMLSRNNLIFEV